MKPSTCLLRALGLVAILTIATGCSPSLRTSQFAFGDNAGVFTNGNLRLVTERHRFQPASGRDLMTVCTEPSPDYAIAFDQSGDISATLAKLGNGDFSFGSHEQTTKLDGRNAGVLALRDGLYAACQSYVNGVIGHDAYALILSQYSELIVELIHEQDAVAADAAKPKADETANPTPAAPAPATPAKAVKAALAEQDAASTWTGGATLLIADLPLKTKTKTKAKTTKSPDVSQALAKAEALTSQGAAYSALLVACLSEHDPTRIGGETDQPKNDMLSLDYCSRFLRKAVNVAGPGLSAR